MDKTRLLKASSSYSKGLAKIRSEEKFIETLNESQRYEAGVWV